MAEIKIPITYSLESLDKISSQFDELIKKSNISDLFKPDQEKIRGYFAAIRKDMEEQLKSGTINVKAIDFTKAQKAIEKFASKVAYVLDEAFDQDTLPLIKKITGITETITNTQDEIKKLKTEFDSLISGNKNKLDEFKNKFASAFGKDAPTDLEGAKLQLAQAQKTAATPASSGAANIEMYRQLVDMAENYQGILRLQTSILNVQKELEQAITEEKNRQLKDEQDIQALKEKNNATNVQLAFPDIAANNKAYEEQVNAYKEIKSAVDDTYNSIRQMESKFSAPERIILARAAKPGATNTSRAKELMGEDEFAEYKRLNDQYDRAAKLLREIGVSISEINQQSKGTTWYADKLKAIELLYQKTGELTEQQEALKFSDMDLAKEIALGSAGAQDFADKMRLSDENIQKLKEYVQLEEKITTLRLAAKNLAETRLGINLTDEKERLKELQNTLSSFNIDSDTKDIFLNDIPADANPDEEFARTGGYGLSQEQFKQYIKTLAEYKIQLQVVLASEATLSETGKAMAEEKARQNEKSEQIAARELENKKQQNIATRQQLELQKQILGLQSALDSRKQREETFKQRFNLTELPTTDPAVAQSMLAKAQSDSAAGQDTSGLQEKISLLRELVEILQEREDLEEKSLEISEKESEVKDALNEKAKLEVQLQQAKTNLGSEESLNVSQDLLKSTEELNDLKAAGAGIDKESTKEIKENTKAKKDNSDEDDKGTKSIVEKGLATISYTFIMSNLRKAINESLKAVREIDKAMTEAAIVTNLNRQEAYKLLGAYQDLARKTGLATSEIGAIVVDFLKQGRGIKDAMELAEVAAKAAKVAGINANDAVDYLTAAVNGFGLAVSQAEDIADKFSAIAAASASDFQELAIAMSKVAPVAKTSGVGVDFMMGVLAKGLETTREAPENIGTAFKTIFARMREITDIGKATEDGMGLNRVEKALGSIGVRLRDSAGQFRNLEDVLIDVGNQWDTLSSIEQAYIATALAGTRQQPRLLAIFNDFARTKELIQISTDAVGGLANQHAEYMKGAEAALAQLKTAWEGFIMSFTDSDLIVGSITLISDLINGFTSLVEFFGNFANINLLAITALALAFVGLGVQQLNLQRIKEMDIQQNKILIDFNTQYNNLTDEEIEKIKIKINEINRLRAGLEDLNSIEQNRALGLIAKNQQDIIEIGNLQQLNQLKMQQQNQEAILIAMQQQKSTLSIQEMTKLAMITIEIKKQQDAMVGLKAEQQTQHILRIEQLQQEANAILNIQRIENKPVQPTGFFVSLGKAFVDVFKKNNATTKSIAGGKSTWSSFGASIGKATGALIVQAGQMLVNMAIMAAMTLAISAIIAGLSWLASWAWESFMDMAGGADHFSKKITDINVKLNDLGDKEKSVQKLAKRFEELNKNAFKTATQFDEILTIIKELESVEFGGKKYNLTRTDITGRIIIDQVEYKKFTDAVEAERQKLLETKRKSFMTSLKNDFAGTLKNDELMDVAKMIGYDFGLKFIDSLKDSIDDNLKNKLKGVAARLSDLIDLTDFQEKTWKMTNIIPDWLGGNYFRIIIPLYTEKYSPEELKEMLKEYTEKVLAIFKKEFEKYENEIEKINADVSLTPQKKTEDIFLAGAEAYRAAEAELRRTIKDPADLQVAIQLLTESMQDEKLLNELINNRQISVEVVAQMSLDLDLAAIKKLFDNLKKEVQELMTFTIYGNFLQNRDNNSDFGNALREWFASTGGNIDDFAESIFDNLFSKTATGISEGFDDLSDFYQLAVQAGTMTAEEAQKALMAVANSIDKFSISELATKLQDDMKLAKNAFNLYKDIAKGELGTFAQIVETFGVGAAKALMSGDISAVTAFFDKQNLETIKQIENSIEVIERAAQEREKLGGVGLTTAENQEIEGLEIMIEYYREIAIQEQLRNYRLQKASELLKEMNNLLSLQQKLADLGIGGPLIDMLDQIADQSYTAALGSLIEQFNADMETLTTISSEEGATNFIEIVDGEYFFNPDEMGRGQALVENVLNSFTQLIDGVTAAYNRQKKEIEQRYKAEQDAIKTSHADRWSQIDYVNKLAEAENKIIEGRRRLAGLVLSGISRGTLEQAQKDLKKLQEERQRIIEQQMVDKATKQIEKQMDEELIAVQQELTSVLDRLIATMETYTNVLTETTDPSMPPGTSSNATGDGTSGSNYTRTVTLQARQLDATEDLVDRTEELNITSGLLKANILDLSSKTFDLTSGIAALGTNIGSSIAESGLLDANYDLISSLSKLSGIIQDGIVLKETNGGSTTVPVDTTAIDGIPNQ